MRPFNRLKTSVGLALASTIMLAAASVQALPIIKADYQSFKGGNATGVVPPSASSATGGGGLFLFAQDASTPTPDLLPLGANFVGFCLEFNENLDPGLRSYDLVTLDAAPIDAGGALPFGMGLARANLIATIIGNTFGLSGPPSYAAITNAVALSVQLAIWEIVHESGTIGDVTSGNADWSSADGSGLADANTLLGKAINLTSGWVAYTAAQVGLSALVSQPTSDNKQDFLVWSRDPSQEVPLPAAAWLLLSGLASLAPTASRNAFRSVFPLLVVGNASTQSARFGTANGGSRCCSARRAAGQSNWPAFATR
jgi:hypothetical protein